MPPGAFRIFALVVIVFVLKMSANTLDSELRGDSGQSVFPDGSHDEDPRIGGRKGRVIKVTNLQDSGPGSLRAALETGGPRIVLFDALGAIELQSPIVVDRPNVTIAGQSAPLGGICVVGDAIEIEADEVVIRAVRAEILRNGKRVDSSGNGCAARGSARAVIGALDADGDGMPDAWERRYGFDARSPADGWRDADEDGYTNIEEYVNGTDPRVYVDYALSQ